MMNTLNPEIPFSNSVVKSVFTTISKGVDLNIPKFPVSVLEVLVSSS